jgi:hypothetical protein
VTLRSRRMAGMSLGTCPRLGAISIDCESMLQVGGCCHAACCVLCCAAVCRLTARTVSVALWLVRVWVGISS